MMYTQPEQQGLYDSVNEHDACGIGFVANINGQQSHEIIQRGLQVLERMAHRGAEGADNESGDGAGILLQVPDIFQRWLPQLPATGQYGTGLVFFPTEIEQIEYCKNVIERIVTHENFELIAWRDVPRDGNMIGRIARASEPVIEQIFIAPRSNIQDQDELERKLYIIRKQIEKQIRESHIPLAKMFYIVSLSCKTMIYKGMFTSAQLRQYFLDLQNKDLESAIALVHSRFSTNTFPTWDLAQPFRALAHNGEINTIKANRFWLHASEDSLESPVFGDDIKKVLPVIEPDKSDSASLDNALELLVHGGRSLPHALMMLIPESFNMLNPIPDDVKYFYEYHSAFLEPWDGPAALLFSDGRYVGGTLDRNGLRPSRYLVTKDGLIVMGSETGVQDFAPERIASKGRLRPGKLLLVDTQAGRIIPDEEIKHKISNQQPYTEWVEKNRITMKKVPAKRSVAVGIAPQELHELHLLFGYRSEDVENIITPMVNDHKEPVSSMGTDTPLAVFSEKPQRLFNYFKQIFAQVTNPAIDPIREKLVMTLTGYIGKEGSLLAETPEHCHMVQFKNPFFTNLGIDKLRTWNEDSFKAASLDVTWPVSEGVEGLEKALQRLWIQAENLTDKGYSFIILSDRNANEENIPIPSLLACASVHHHLVRVKKRTQVALVIETAEACEVMHFALLFGYGASAVNPYGAFATIYDLFTQGRFPNISDYLEAENNYIEALHKGLLKILSKLGISTLRSYHGAQTFEAVGLGEDLIETHFTGTDSRIGGIGLPEIAQEALMRHHMAFVERPELLPSEGVYQYRKDGEKHAWNPEAIAKLQWAVRSGDYEKYKEFARLVNGQNQRPHVIRGLLDFIKRDSIPISEVEPAAEILKRFTTGAMSFGSLGEEIHETIAIAMNTIGGRSNSGEGGEDPQRYQLRPDGTSSRSAIKQVASGRFGVTINYLVNADELQIKVAQGAKPGEGGQLPGHKVDEKIAKTRYATPGVTLISPPPHHDIYSIEDLKQLIFDLKNANPAARVSVKLVSEVGVGTIAAGVAKAHADNIVISGYDGGTGASPQSSIKHAGLPFELGIAETHQTLLLNNLRGRVRLQTDGQLKTGRDVVLAAILGAEEFAFGTASLIVLGCVMMRKCHKNTCPVGIATQNRDLRALFAGKPDHLINYFTFMAEEVREIMAELGVRTFNELVGQTNLVQVRSTDHWKASTVNLEKILYRPKEVDIYPNYCVETQAHQLEHVFDRELIQRAQPALENKEQVKIEFPITNVDRTVGTMLSGEVAKRYGSQGLPDGTIQCEVTGSAGQSFGAFLAKGITMRLHGDANDYFGKGLSGGKLIALPPEGSTFAPEENIIIGNTAFYGATGGEAYIRGVAGERFCVRNSGVHAVVEGLGDHGAEYMTGGGLIVLGSVGRNFAAGMSGGIAYVLNLNGSFNYFCNLDMVELTPAIGLEDQKYIKQQLLNHIHYTESSLAQSILDQWYKFMPRFIKVLPLDYKRVLEETKDHERTEQSGQMMTEYKISPGMAKAEMFEEVS
ncbi:MAG: glutamate synthase large subunit [Anaerolineales bacterium]|nr:glutamate synthase large subunit [Anaerolineales bacterium]